MSTPDAKVAVILPMAREMTRTGSIDAGGLFFYFALLEQAGRYGEAAQGYSVLMRHFPRDPIPRWALRSLKDKLPWTQRIFYLEGGDGNILFTIYSLLQHAAHAILSNVEWEDMLYT